jgi:hypothetical protein
MWMLVDMHVDNPCIRQHVCACVAHVFGIQYWILWGIWCLHENMLRGSKQCRTVLLLSMVVADLCCISHHPRPKNTQSLNVYTLAARRRELQAIIEEIRETRLARQQAAGGSTASSTSTALSESGGREKSMVMNFLDGVKSLKHTDANGKTNALVMLLDVPKLPNGGTLQRMYLSVSQFIDRIWSVVWPASQPPSRSRMSITSGSL